MGFTSRSIGELKLTSILWNGYRWLEREARIDECSANRIRIFFRNAARTHSVVPSAANLVAHVIDDFFRFASLQQKARTLRENVLRIRVAAHVPTIHGKISPLLRDDWRGRQIVSGRELPVPILRNHRLIARVIIDVRD